MRIRTAAPSDLDAVWALEREIFGSEAWSREAMRSELEGEHRRYIVLVDGVDGAEGAGDTGDANDADDADDAGEVRGYAGLLAVGGDGDIQTIAVSPEARGGGHGRRLIHELLDTAESRGVKQVFLEVRADNPIARGLYESLGFTEIAVRARYYQPDDVDAIVMRLLMEERRA